MIESFLANAEYIKIAILVVLSILVFRSFKKSEVGAAQEATESRIADYIGQMSEDITEDTIQTFMEYVEAQANRMKEGKDPIWDMLDEPYVGESLLYRMEHSVFCEEEFWINFRNKRWITWREKLKNWSEHPDADATYEEMLTEFALPDRWIGLELDDLTRCWKEGEDPWDELLIEFEKFNEEYMEKAQNLKHKEMIIHFAHPDEFVTVAQECEEDVYNHLEQNPGSIEDNTSFGGYISWTAALVGSLLLLGMLWGMMYFFGIVWKIPLHAMGVTIHEGGISKLFTPDLFNRIFWVGTVALSVTYIVLFFVDKDTYETNWYDYLPPEIQRNKWGGIKYFYHLGIYEKDGELEEELTNHYIVNKGGDWDKFYNRAPFEPPSWLPANGPFEMGLNAYLIRLYGFTGLAMASLTSLSFIITPIILLFK